MSKIEFNRRPEILQNVLEEVKQELISATEEFGKFNSTHEGYAIIKEELDELWTLSEASSLTCPRESQGFGRGSVK